MFFPRPLWLATTLKNFVFCLTFLFLCLGLHSKPSSPLQQVCQNASFFPLLAYVLSVLVFSVSSAFQCILSALTHFLETLSFKPVLPVDPHSPPRVSVLTVDVCWVWVRRGTYLVGLRPRSRRWSGYLAPTACTPSGGQVVLVFPMRGPAHSTIFSGGGPVCLHASPPSLR